MKFRNDVKKIKALADENRLAIMLLLQGGEKCGCILLEELNITQPTLSHHMRLLCDSGLVTGRKEVSGCAIPFHLKEPSHSER